MMAGHSRRPPRGAPCIQHPTSISDLTVTLITACSSGFGLGTAVHLAARGQTVYATMRNVGSASALREAAAADGVTLAVLPLDVDDPHSVEGAVAEVLSREGRIDVLVNNAGVG